VRATALADQGAVAGVFATISDAAMCRIMPGLSIGLSIGLGIRPRGRLCGGIAQGGGQDPSRLLEALKTLEAELG